MGTAAARVAEETPYVLMAINYTGFTFAKPEPRKKTRARAKREKGERNAEIRVYVFGRERGLCRCCRIRRAKSMHEMRFKSLGGKVSKRNSIAVCGNGIEGCHGFLQRLQIDAEYTELGAEGRIVFRPRTPQAMEWLKLHDHAVIESAPMSEYQA